MIGYLRGRLVYAEDDSMVIDAGGVGYEVFPTLDAFNQAAAGEEVELFVHTLVREDDISLYGFSTRSERALFQLLISISGVGPRSAITMVSQMGEAALVETILTGNSLPLTRIKGIGKRIAERVILETRDKVDKLYAGGAGPAAPFAAQARLAGGLIEVQEALLGLGFKRAQVTPVLAALHDEKDRPVDELIRAALKRLKR